MYNLVSRITDGLGELKKLLETHIYNQGLAAIEKCGEAALNVSLYEALFAMYITPSEAEIIMLQTCMHLKHILLKCSGLIL